MPRLAVLLEHGDARVHLLGQIHHAALAHRVDGVGRHARDLGDQCRRGGLALIDVATFFLCELDIANRSPSPTTRTAPTRTHVIVLLRLPPRAATAVRPLRCWGRRFAEPRVACLFMKLLGGERELVVGGRLVIELVELIVVRAVAAENDIIVMMKPKAASDMNGIDTNPNSQTYRTVHGSAILQNGPADQEMLGVGCDKWRNPIR